MFDKKHYLTVQAFLINIYNHLHQWRSKHQRDSNAFLFHTINYINMHNIVQILLLFFALLFEIKKIKIKNGNAFL